MKSIKTVLISKQFLLAIVLLAFAGAAHAAGLSTAKAVLDTVVATLCGTFAKKIAVVIAAILSFVWVENNMKKIKYLFALALYSLTNISYAEGFAGGEKSAEGVLSWLTGTLAVSIATIAIVWVGYKVLFARDMERGVAFKIIGGIVLIFGAPQVVTWVQGLAS